MTRVLWIPTGKPPYRRPPFASTEHRLAMLKLAISGEPRYVIDGRELAPEASGYTYETVKALRAENPGTGLILLMGADQYVQRESWHRWPELAKLCRIAVIERPHFLKPEGDIILMSMTPLAMSASDIRERIARGEDVSAMLPAAVLEYIGKHKLYR